MTYIYDIVLNFSDINCYYEFYEWKSSDNIVNVKKLPIFRVDDFTINDFINYNVVVDKDFLNKIKDQFILLRKDKKNYSYIVILSNTKKSIGLVFNHYGKILYKSSMLLDEENDANLIAFKLSIQKINYVKKSKKIINQLLRDDFIKSDYLIKEIKKIYDNKNFEKLKYLYYELYDLECDDYEKMYKDFMLSLKKYSDKCDKLYVILKKQYKLIEN